jgi:hypothetical protein
MEGLLPDEEAVLGGVAEGAGEPPSPPATAKSVIFPFVAAPAALGVTKGANKLGRLGFSGLAPATEARRGNLLLIRGKL